MARKGEKSTNSNLTANIVDAVYRLRMSNGQFYPCGYSNVDFARQTNDFSEKLDNN